MDAELEFAIQPNTTGKQLFDQVGITCNLLSLVCSHPKSVVTSDRKNPSACVFKGGQDHRAAGGLVFWAPVPGHQGFLHVAQA